MNDNIIKLDDDALDEVTGGVSQEEKKVTTTCVNCHQKSRVKVGQTICELCGKSLYRVEN